MWLVKNYQTFCEIKKKIFVCLCIKWLILAKKTYENNNMDVIVGGIGMLWLNEKNIGKKLGIKNLPATTNKYDPVYKKHIYKLVNRPKKQLNRRFLRADLALKVKMDCRKMNCAISKEI